MRSKLECHIDHLSMIGPYVKLSGWAFVEDKPLDHLRIEARGLSVTDAVDLVVGQARPDVARVYSSQTARMSGFFGQGLIVVEDSNLMLIATLGDGSVVEKEVGSITLNGGGAFEFQHEPRRPSSTRLASLFNLHPSYYAMSVLPAINNAPQPVPKASGTPVSVLSSVYKGREYLDDYFGSFRRNTTSHAELIIVDNGNDDQDLVEYLKLAVKEIPRAKLVRVENNEGYIEGIIHANAAREHDGHVVVLNTDIVLPEHWLERLIWPLDNLDRVATVTPYTNAGTVCSFPYIGIDNLMYLGAHVDSVDRAFRHVDPAALAISIPSGVGYCMAMHKTMLKEIGYFESKTFGLGYGEENDWCLKAEALGWSNMLLPNMFVYHKHGGVYPSEQKQALILKNLETIDERYPHYSQSVSGHFNADENAALREFMAFTIAARGSEFKVSSYDENAIQDLVAGLKNDAFGISFYQTSDQASWIAIMRSNGARWLLWGVGASERDRLISTLKGLCAAA